MKLVAQIYNINALLKKRITYTTRVHKNVVYMHHFTQHIQLSILIKISQPSLCLE